MIGKENKTNQVDYYLEQYLVEQNANTLFAQTQWLWAIQAFTIRTENSDALESHVIQAFY